MTKTDFNWITYKTGPIMGTQMFQRLPEEIYHEVLEVKKGGLKNAGFGLSSCKKIKRQIFTVYVGKIIEPSKNSIYSGINGDIVIDCRTWRKGMAYLDAHICNDTSWNGQKSSVRHNIKICRSLEIVTTSATNVGKEILLKYNDVKYSIEIYIF